MTIQQHASFDAEAAGLNATSNTNPAVSKMVKLWESKNAKRAVKASGATLMALSLSACGGSDDVAVVTPVTPVVDAAQAFALTAGIDAGADFTGGSGADTFTANKADGTNHLTSLDALDGGAGVDTLTGSFTASFDSSTAVSATVVNIENVVFTTTDDMTVNTTAWTGVENLTVTAVNAVVATAAVTTDIVAATGNLDTLSTINGGKDVTFTSAESVTLAVSTANTTSSAITIGGTTAAKGAITVTHTETYVDDTTAGADTAAGSTITVTGGTTVVVNSLASLGNQASAHDDTATTGAVSVTGTADTTSVTVTQSAAVNTAGTAGLSMDHANGAVTIADKNASSATAAGTITSATLNNYGASTVNSGALETVSISGDGGTLGITAGALTSAVVDTLTLNADTATAGAITVDADYTTLNINGSTAASTIANVTASGATTVNFTGAADVTLTNNTFAAATDINVTGAGGVTLGTTALAAGTDFDGNSGDDSVILGVTTQGITMGAGDDTVTYGGAAGTGGSVDAGAGTDTIVMTDAQAAAADDNTTFNTTFTNFEKLSISGAFIEDSLNLTTLNGVSDVTLAGALTATAGLSNMASGGTVTLTQAGASTPVLNVGVAGALVGTADVLNVAIKNAAAKDVGVVAAANVEEINVTAADATAAGGTAVRHTLSLSNEAYKTVTVSGNNGLALTANGTSLTSFDASGVVANGTADTAALLAVTNTFGALTAAATISGGAGNDTLNAAAATKAVTINGNAGADILTGSATAASTINGGAGDDTLTGGAAADVIDGGTGTDTFVFSSANIVEQAGASTTTGVVINLGATELTGAAVNTASSAFIAQGTTVASNTATYLFNGDNSTNASIVDTLTGVENATGSNLADYIVGSATANVITGGAGADVMTGGTGADTFVYDNKGHGADTITDFTVSDVLSFVDGTNLALDGTATELFVKGTAAAVKTAIAGGGTAVKYNVIVLTDAVGTFTEAGIDAVLTTAFDKANATDTTGTIVVAAAATGDAKVFFDADGGDTAGTAGAATYTLATLEGVELADLATLTADNFVIA